ncbi:MAG: hypothetical protein GEU82_04315 [Luteitalea sp.]|nr:hypothetical protein [Luteitalea sp.]
MAEDAPASLSPAESARLIEFARAFKAAARAVVLYPAGHPAIDATLGRLVQLTSSSALAAPLRIAVLTDALLVDGLAPLRPDPAIRELAITLHAHLIGELVVHPGGDVESWRGFLLLIGRGTEDIRTEGGIARLWTTMAGRHVELREIDYAEVLREDADGGEAGWAQVVASCLHGHASDLSVGVIQALLPATLDPSEIASAMQAIDAKATEGSMGIGARSAALMRVLRGILDAVGANQPDRLQPVLDHLGSAVGQLTPDTMLALLSQSTGTDPAARGLVSTVVSHIPDSAIAGFVARNATSEDAALDRVAQAFQALVTSSEQRERLLTLAHDEAARSSVGGAADFAETWDKVAAKLMASYSDKPFVSDDYADELSGARTQALEVEQVGDDPADRLAGWLGTVATTELRKLDLMLVLDVLRIESDHERWSSMMPPVVALLEDLFFVGDLDAAESLVGVLAREARADPPTGRGPSARAAIDQLVAGPMMRHIVAHLVSIDEPQLERLKAMCVSLGSGLIHPLGEALAIEERSLPSERLTAILIAFGAIGRREVEHLKTSPNASVRRTAIYLLREFGGSDALPELTELLDDQEQGVQREAVRAILNIGTNSAYQVLQEALASGTTRSRGAIMQSVTILRDERAAPLFVYILRHVDHRGPLGWVYARALEALGTLRDPDSVPALTSALYRGEWWAPRRTSALRSAAAAALARIGTAPAIEALEEAARSRSRQVRAAARAHLHHGQPLKIEITR